MGSIAASSTDGAELSEDRLLARFDELVESGAVVYNRNYRSVRLVDQGFSVRITLHPNLHELERYCSCIADSNMARSSVRLSHPL